MRVNAYSCLLFAAAVTPALCSNNNATAKPNLIILVADDLGHNDVGWANPRTITPNLDNLVKDGMELTQFYVFKYCAPTRGALQTGRYPYHFGFYTNQDSNDYGVPSNFTMLPQKLKELGNYRTHAIGKWHCGFRSKELTPTYRGYDTFLGYYHMEEDYFTHSFPGLVGQCNSSQQYTDFSNSSGADIKILWGHGGSPAPSDTPTPAAANAKDGAWGCTVVKNECIHQYEGLIANISTQNNVGCCQACQQNPTCRAWNWVHNESNINCYLKNVASLPNGNHSQCDHGYIAKPPAYSEADYSAYIFSTEAIRIVNDHAANYAPSGVPFFMYLAMQSVHGPEEAPPRFVNMYADNTTSHYIADSARRMHQGMVTALDEAIGNVTIAMKAAGLWENTFIWFTSDNGGPLPVSNNFPMRGGKFTNWEGGTRVRSFVHSANPSILPPARYGTLFSGLLHAVDVYSTMVTIAGLKSSFDPASTGPVPLDGYDQYAALRSGNASASLRTEILYAAIVGVVNNTNALNPEDCTTRWGQACGGALRVGDYKLIVGYPGDSRALPLPATELRAAAIADADDRIYGNFYSDRVTVQVDQSGGGPGPDGCDYNNGTGCPCHHLNGGPCLFNVARDVTESHNLAADPAYASIKRALLKRMSEYASTHMPPAGLIGALLTADEQLQCDYIKEHKAFEPYGDFIPWAV